jgi:hypothetical protein
MKKIKWTIMTLVVLFSIGAAFATRPAKLQSGLYYFNGTEYLAVSGAMGQGYYCVATYSYPCTYTYANGVYTPYINNAQYVPLGIDGKPHPIVKKDK